MNLPGRYGIVFSRMSLKAEAATEAAPSMRRRGKTNEFKGKKFFDAERFYERGDPVFAGSCRKIEREEEKRHSG